MMGPIIFQNQGQNIFGMLHPAKGVKKAPLVVLCHGWSGNHLGVWNGFFVHAARRFAEGGFAVLRFDFRGSGNSDGEFEEQTITSMVSDLGAVLDQVSERDKSIDVSRVALVGHSQGAYAAILRAASDKRVKAVVSWMGRISDFKDFASKTWVEEAERKGYTFFSDGFTVRYDPYITDSKNYSLSEALGKMRASLGLIYGEADDVVPPSEGLKAQKYAKGPTELKIFEPLGHDFTGTEGIQDEVIATTQKWLEKWL